MLGSAILWRTSLSLALLLFLQISGCFTVRVRAVHWPGMMVRREFAWMLPAPEPMYYPYIQIDLRANPKPFFLKMADGVVIESKDCTFQNLKKYFKQTEKLTETYLPDTDRGIIGFGQGDIDVMFEGDKATRVTVGSYWIAKRDPRQTRPAISADGKRFLTFPATQEELILMFGKPTKIETYLFNT